MCLIHHEVIPVYPAQRCSILQNQLICGDQNVELALPMVPVVVEQFEAATDLLNPMLTKCHTNATFLSFPFLSSPTLPVSGPKDCQGSNLEGAQIIHTILKYKMRICKGMTMCAHKQSPKKRAVAMKFLPRHHRCMRLALTSRQCFNLLVISKARASLMCVNHPLQFSCFGARIRMKNIGRGQPLWSVSRPHTRRHCTGGATCETP